MKHPGFTTDYRINMRAATHRRGALRILGVLEDRFYDAMLIKWPALAESFRKELEECREIARAKGLIA